MLERYRTLAAVLALQRFTVEDLAGFSGVKKATVRTVLKRDDHYVEKVGHTTSSRPGGRYIQYRLRPAKESELLRELEELENVGAGAIAAKASTQGPSRVHVDLIAAEDILLFQFPTTQDSDDRERLLRLARLHFMDGFQAPIRTSRDLRAVPVSVEADTENHAHTRAVDILLRLSEAENVADRSPAEASASFADLRRDWRDFLANLPKLQDRQLLPNLFDRVSQSPLAHLLAGEPEAISEELAQREDRACSAAEESASLSPSTRLMWELLRRRGRTEVRVGRNSVSTNILRKSGERSKTPLPSQFYTVVERMAGGRDRALVYRDLLAVTPSQYSYDIARTVLPDVVVEVIAEHTASNHLEKLAASLEDDLERSPFFSDAALIGQTAHSLYQMALDYNYLDESIMTRSDAVRKDLLELGGLRLAPSLR